jgi:rod shape-determining protein MreC
VFPRGLNVGTIESIAPDPDHQPYTLIKVRPAVNLSQLEEVLVITGTQSNLPSMARTDLAEGLKTAEAQAAAKAAEEAAASTAAQVIADRLPSLHEGENTSGTASADGKTPAGQPPGGTVPKPLPTLHPDRYTPGVTPPASLLTPGAIPQPQATTPSQPSTETRPKTANPDN